MGTKSRIGNAPKKLRGDAAIGKAVQQAVRSSDADLSHLLPKEQTGRVVTAAKSLAAGYGASQTRVLAARQAMVDFERIMSKGGRVLRVFGPIAQRRKNLPCHEHRKTQAVARDAWAALQKAQAKVFQSNAAIDRAARRNRPAPDPAELEKIVLARDAAAEVYHKAEAANAEAWAKHKAA